MKRVAIAAFALAAATAFPAAAQFNTSALYVGAGVGQSKAKDWCSGVTAGVSCDDKDTAWKVFGGYQLNRNFAAELGYTKLGDFKASALGIDDTAKVTAWELSALGAFPLMSQFAIFGRLGAYHAQVKEDVNVGGSAKNSNTGLTFGAGLQFDVTRNIGLRGEWQRYSRVGGGDVALGNGTGEKSDIDVLGVSALWRF